MVQNRTRSLRGCWPFHYRYLLCMPFIRLQCRYYVESFTEFSLSDILLAIIHCTHGTALNGRRVQRCIELQDSTFLSILFPLGTSIFTTD